MIGNSLKVACKNVFRQKLHSAINVIGLAIALSCCLLIGLFVLFEFSYDGYHRNTDRIFRISGEYDTFNSARVSALAAPLLAQDFPQIVEEAGRLYGFTPALFTRGDISSFEDNVRFADNAFFRIFDFEWLQGDPQTALLEPDTVVLTESLANKYFPGESPLGQTLSLSPRELPMTVAGVISDPPENTHLSFSAVGSMDLGLKRSGFTRELLLENWNLAVFNTYVLLKEGADIGELERELGDFLDSHLPQGAILQRLSPINIQDIHLSPGLNANSEMKPPGNIASLLVLVTVAFCILAIACINFMNLSTAQSTRRAMEIGMRKAIGARRLRLVAQFLGESLVMSALAMIIALMLVELTLPIFSAFIGKELDPAFLGWLKLSAFLFGVTVLVGLAAGCYPAFFLSALQPSRALKGEFSRGPAGAALRNILVLIQFSVSIILIIATVVIYQQMAFARNTGLGFKTEQMVIVEGSLRSQLGPRWRELRDRLQQHPAVVNAAASTFLPFTRLGASRTVFAEGRDQEVVLNFFTAGVNFFETYDMEVLAGRTFSENRLSDQSVYPSPANLNTSGAFMLNEAAASLLGWTAEEAVGKQLVEMRNDIAPGASVTGPVIGVLADAWLESVRDEIRPLIFHMPPESNPGQSGSLYTNLSINIRADDMPSTLAYIDATWNEFNPDTPIRRHFLDADFDAVYLAEQQQGEMLRYFAAIAVSLACSGLFGLAAFNAQRRTKEIGVRKVMGSSVWAIVVLLTSDFSRLVLLSNLIAWPVAWYAMNQWLANFAYRIDLTPLIFIGSGLIALCIAWVTVGGTAARAASRRPVLALRYE